MNKNAIERRLSLKYPPLALYHAAEAPSGAKSYRQKKSHKGGWGCAMLLVAQSLKGATVAFSKDTCLCPGSVGGFALGMPSDEDFPGGPEASLRFLSTGNKHWDTGQATAEEMRRAGASQDKLEEYLEGEGFKKNPELVLDYYMKSPQLAPKAPYVVIQPLDAVPQGQKPDVVIILADMEQLSALVVLANYARPGSDNVRIPFAAGCQSIGTFPLWEATQENPKAIVGLTDISARLYLRKLMGRDLVSFAMPFDLYAEMEGNAEESFLNRHAWNALRASLP